MRRYQTVLGLLLLLCILLNCAGCDFRTNYDVFSSGNRKITSVSSSLRDPIGIVLDNEDSPMSGNDKTSVPQMLR